MTAHTRPPALQRWLRAALALGLLVAQLAGLAIRPALAASSTVVISQFQVVGATAADEFVELHNVGATPFDLNGHRLVYRSAAGTSDVILVTWASNTVIPAGGFYLIGATPGYDDSITADTTFVNSGTGALAAASGGLALRNGAANTGTIIDSVGYGSATNAFVEGTTTTAPSANASRVRTNNSCADTDSNSVDFTGATPATPRNSASPVASCGTTVTVPSISTQPQSQTIASGQTATLSVVAGGTAPLTYQWYEGASGTTTTPVGTDSASFTTPALTADTSYWMRVSNSAGSADSAAATITIGAPVACSAADTAIGAVQGTAETAALNGQTVTVQGVVVGDYEGASPALRGFYLQDSGDGDSATSDGIFVFEIDNGNRVAVGDVVQVSGVVSENQGQTQIGTAAAQPTVESCGATGTVTPQDVTLPFASASAAESTEGMLVRLPQALSVTEHFQLGRFGQVVLSSGGRLKQPTNVAAPGAPAAALQAQNNLNRIILDDDSQNQNPDPIVFGRGGSPLSAANTLRGGDTATGIVGVMTYTWAGNSASGNAYRVRPIGALGGTANFQPANPRPTAPPSVGGSLRVVGMNLLNFFNTFDGLPDTVDNCTNGVGGAATDCRGADTQTEFDRQWPKTVAAIVKLNPDVVGFNEIENDGYGPTSAIAFLVDQLNAATAPGTYAFIDADAATGQVNALGTDAIKVGLIYKPAAVTPVGQTAVLNTAAFVNGGDGAPRSRPSLAQAFEQNAGGARFIVDVNHLKSKGSACDAPDAGDGQGNCNAVRTNAANQLVSWLATNPTGTGDTDILLVGDYNSYAQEDPITAIKSAGYVNLIETLLGLDAYSYAFDGQWGYLDHALASASLAGQVSGVGDYHINADEPSVLDYNTDFKTPNLQTTLFAADEFRVSDHDPVIVGLSLTPPAAGAPTITAQPQSQTINSGQTATLSVTATGTAPLSYQWYAGASGDTSAPVGTDSASFTTPALTTTASYWVRVSNSAGTADSATATLTVQQPATPPTITTEPQSQTIASGQTATLTVAASGTAPLSYQWYAGASGTTSAPVGTNSASFTTPALTATASYWVRVTNGAGSDDSATATITVTPAAATISLTALDTAYSQSFDTLASSGTSSVTPAGWFFAESGTNANTTYTAGTGSGNTGDTYSFGASGSSERAFGGLLSSSLTPTTGAWFVNDTGATITTLQVSYTGEQWRLGTAGRNDRLDFQYSTNATSLTSGTWVDANAADFSGPISAGTTGALDGNAATNRTLITATIGGLTIPSGATFWIRWTDFNASGSDDGMAVDDFSLTPSFTAAPTITTEPQSQTINSGQTATLTVAASGTAPLSYQWYAGASGDTSAPVGTNSASFTTPALTATASYWVRVSNSAGSADSATATITVTNICQDSATPIYTVQGSGASTPLSGQTVTVRGVVVADFQDTNGTGQSGFYLQEQTGDGDALTSDGVFVFIPAANALSSVDVAVGDVVALTGRATEFNTLTEIDNVTALTACGSITPPAPVSVSLPETINGELERYEGMLITIPQTLTAQQNFFQGRYGQVTLGVGRLFQPTNSFDAGSAEAIAAADLNARSLIVLDDGRSGQNPNPIPYIGQDNTLRAGDTVAGLTGALDFGPINSDTSIRDYRLQPTAPVNFTRVNERPAAPDAVGGNVTVASFNVLNYFNGDGQGGGFPTARGATNAAEFDRQRAKTIAAITAIDPDVVGLMEMENDGTGSLSAVQDLVNGLNDATGAGTYAFVAEPAPGTDVIKVAMIYKPAQVTPVGAAANYQVSDATYGAELFDRPPLAQTFRHTATGEVFTVIVNHFKSKGSCPSSGIDTDQGDGQGCWNAKRVRQAQELLGFIAALQASSGDQDVVVIGDLNSYGAEDPIQVLTAAGLVNQLAARLTSPYSYVFDGLAGYLDHALTTASLDTQVSGVTEWHINADEPSVIDYNTEFKPQDLYAATPYRASDHDPVIVGLNLVRPNVAPTADSQSVTTAEDTAAAITLAGSDGDGDALTYSIVSGPTKGTLSGTAPNLTYTPNSNVSGSDSFTFKVNDGTVDSPVATVSITITPVNDAPTAVNDTATTRRNTAVIINVRANDSDVDGDRLTLVSLTRPAHGVVVGIGGLVFYVPRPGFTGTDTFTYTVSDGKGGLATATVTVTVRR